MTKSGIALAAVILTASAVLPATDSAQKDRAQVLALETAWNHAIEVKDTRALDLILADTLVALGSDGSLSNK